MPLLLLVLILVPIAEIAVFIQVGQWIGLGPTLLGILLTAVLGAALVRRQGFRTVRDTRAALQRDELPVRQLFDGLCLFIAGICLLTPGFITDAIGFLLLVPPLRAMVGRRLWDVLQRHGRVTVATRGMGGGGMGGGGMGGSGTGGGPRRPPFGGDRVIDAEYHEVDGADEGDPKGADLPPVRGSRWGRRDG